MLRGDRAALRWHADSPSAVCHTAGASIGSPALAARAHRLADRQLAGDRRRLADPARLTLALRDDSQLLDHCAWAWHPRAADVSPAGAGVSARFARPAAGRGAYRPVRGDQSLPGRADRRAVG